MKKYCPVCEKEYDFKVKSMKDLDELICPVCGNKVEKDSKKPSRIAQGEQVEDKIGEGLSSMLSIWWYFRWICVFAGLIAYFWLPSTVFTVLAVLCGGISLFQYWNILPNALFLAVLAIIGYFFIGSYRGICLGFVVALLLQMLFRKMMGTVISALIRGSRQG